MCGAGDEAVEPPSAAAQPSEPAAMDIAASPAEEAKGAAVGGAPGAVDGLAASAAAAVVVGAASALKPAAEGVAELASPEAPLSGPKKKRPKIVDHWVEDDAKPLKVCCEGALFQQK